MPMFGANEFERHSGGAADRVKVTAGSAKSALAAEGDNSKTAALFAAV